MKKHDAVRMGRSATEGHDRSASRSLRKVEAEDVRKFSGKVEKKAKLVVNAFTCLRERKRKSGQRTASWGGEKKNYKNAGDREESD